ncbi:hypothetical protein A1507_07995 [Methylomonas koyamae]|uniref:AMP-dependent synthetase/ligase domain-containing protein n=1 Tax=Methylomonas koyamae TaxID=702114 RepID=A0A177NQ93_9GAMM|nr:AMP-binding protein [Methylomonas koyamae]OAI19210.1 hypothetical protein A1507_07995 [Methylomonas koyamae]
MWWVNSANLRRLIADIVSGYFATQRLGGFVPSIQNITLADDWLQPPVAMDSIELLDCATQFAQRLHIHDTGLEDLLLIQPCLKNWKAVAEQSLEKAHHNISFFSSGSTGPAQRHCLPAAHLMTEIQFIAEHLLPGTAPVQRRVWTLIPAQHIYGFIFTILLPAALTDRPEVLDGRRRMLSALQREFRPGDIIVAVPDFWRQWVKAGQILPPGAIAITASAPCEPDVLRVLQEQGAEIVEIYGASETGGIGFRKQPDSTFSLMPHWRVEQNNLVSTFHSAAIPDHLQWLDEQSFIVCNRRDGAIQLGGTNVYPDEIAQLICRHDRIEAAAVRLHGHQLKAFLVPNTPIQADAELIADVSAWLAARLPSLLIPKHFTVGVALPRNSMGKLSDWPVKPVVDYDFGNGQQ